jgi:diacylglycerol kinase family enzyme
MADPTTAQETDPSARDNGSKATKRTVKACMIINSKAGKGGADLSTVLPILADQGWEVDVRRKHVDGNGRELAKQAVRDGYEVVIACGGDRP